ncbi:MAG TPA: hypothetical protein VK011_02845 [Acidimicrobiia bacterium]|nr:hypothetical protein [Acidimicrobiia bacterium]
MYSSRPDLRPLSVGEMVDGAIHLYRTHFLTLIKIAAAVLGPIALIEVIATAAIGPVDMSTMLVVDPEANPMELFEPLVPVYTVLLLTSGLSLLGSVLVQGASISALAHSYRGETVDWRTSLRTGGRRFIPLVAATLLISIGSTIGLVFCLIPGIYLFTMWTVTPAALVTERIGPLRAMGRSFRLVRGRFWPVLGALVLAYLLYIVVSQIIGGIAGAVTVASALASDRFSFLPSVIGGAIVEVVAAPFVAAMVTIIYFDLRVRKEGYDLELMARDLERLEPGDGRDGPPSPGDDPFGLGTPGS